MTEAQKYPVKVVGCWGQTKGGNPATSLKAGKEVMPSEVPNTTCANNTAMIFFLIYINLTFAFSTGDKRWQMRRNMGPRQRN